MNRAFAPAKVNLTLHVTGQRSDGYHLLDSLVCFADVGDWITVEKATTTTITVTGPMAHGVPIDSRNLAMRAADMMGLKAKITLEKHLPAAAGIGGGSSDAAATLRALAALYDMPLPNPNALLELGADVPVCMGSQLMRMGGIGENITPLADLPGWPMLLINPRVSVPTGPVFQALPSKSNAPMPDDLPLTNNINEFAAWIAAQRNDLQGPAIALQPLIADVLAALQDTQSCLIARMSGSGATCFALFETDDDRKAAAAAIKQANPSWWVAPTKMTAGPS